ncbi:hypothetical protein F4561_005445 [Lipingzhangella halophila]|uniref:Polyketide cyclase/dehydrase/lipid transport protein n=1 Tax=Lipingzhangella halophila TaxID=1783352 RepID=A0A7W7RMB0_9ACTN|nr:SRPBCC family protein [Lipingzhangella halophila]MBB4934625.1 hypothetical protein [Lipingzhangella halophila]
MTRLRKVILSITGALLGVIALLAVIGSVRDTHVVTVTRSTDASRDVLWDLWADVPARTEWDKGLEYIELDGPFEAGTTGTVKVEGQDPINYEVVAVDPKNSYTDRFNSLPWTHTDWHHEIEPNGDGGYDVTWRLEARGPLSLLTLPVLKGIFGEEVPTAVDEFVALAESRS